MANADAVVDTVKARADPKPLADAPKPHAYIRMLQALAELGKGDDGDKLPRGHADQLRDQDDDNIDQQIDQQVITVVAPHGHLSLCVVQ